MSEQDELEAYNAELAEQAHWAGIATEEPSLWCCEIAESQTVEVRPNKSVRLSNFGRCVEMPIKNWIRAATEHIPESVHIDAVFTAIRGYFGPGDAIKVRKRYLEIINEKELKK